MNVAREAAERRAEAYQARADRPTQRHSVGGLHSAVRPLEVREVLTVTRDDGTDAIRIGGYASTTDQPYEMYDAYGPYTEIVSRGAFGATLATEPMVEYTRNHGAGGALPMAHTRNGTLVLTEDKTGLDYTAYADPRRSDVRDLAYALERGDAAESSFKFRIDEGSWNDDYDVFTIGAVDISRGDVSTVNFGANPNTTSALRALVGERGPELVCPECAARAAKISARVVFTDADVRIRK